MLRSLGAAVLVLASSILAACGEVETASPASAALSDDPRYRLELSSEPAEPLPRLLLRVEPREGWKLVPDSPARLRAEAPPGFRFAKTEQRSKDAAEYSEDRLEFGLELRRDGGGSEPPTEDGQAELKFGVCRANSSHCEIVKQRFALPLS